MRRAAGTWPCEGTGGRGGGPAERHFTTPPPAGHPQWAAGCEAILGLYRAVCASRAVRNSCFYFQSEASVTAALPGRGRARRALRRPASPPPLTDSPSPRPLRLLHQSEAGPHGRGKRPMAGRRSPPSASALSPASRRSPLAEPPLPGPARRPSRRLAAILGREAAARPRAGGSGQGARGCRRSPCLRKPGPRPAAP